MKTFWMGIALWVMPFSLAQDLSLVEKRLHALELLKSNLDTFNHCGIFQGENWFWIVVAFPSDDWQHIYYGDYGTFYMAKIEGDKIIPLWCATVTEVNKGTSLIESLIESNTFVKFMLEDKYFYEPEGDMPFYQGEMDVYTSLANSFGLRRINSDGVILCENVWDSNWPGQLPLQQLPNCVINEK